LILSWALQQCSATALPVMKFLCDAVANTRMIFWLLNVSAAGNWLGMTSFLCLLWSFSLYQGC